jgi:hypothetical protein
MENLYIFQFNPAIFKSQIIKKLDKIKHSDHNKTIKNSAGLNFQNYFLPRFTPQYLKNKNLKIIKKNNLKNII